MLSCSNHVPPRWTAPDMNNAVCHQEDHTSKLHVRTNAFLTWR
jgi:hypothetical protein